MCYGKSNRKGTEIHHAREMTTCDPLRYIMDTPVLVAFICMWQSIRIQRIKSMRKFPMTLNLFRLVYKYEKITGRA